MIAKCEPLTRSIYEMVIEGSLPKYCGYDKLYIFEIKGSRNSHFLTILGPINDSMLVTSRFGILRKSGDSGPRYLYI
jgi:hypothetical protein